MDKQIIIFADGAERSRVEAIAASASSEATWVVSETVRELDLPAGAEQITGQSKLQERIAGSSDQMLIVVNAAWNIDLASLSPLIQEARSSDSREMMIFPIMHGASYQFAQELSIDGLLNLFHEAQSWPTGFAVIPSTVMAEVKAPRNCEQFVGQSIIATVGSGCSITLGASPLRLNGSSQWKGTLSRSDLAELLKFTVENINIEELFPNHSWTTHQEESAAACYHTLAALFMKFDDLDAAKECLNYGDQLEDSPRSLALKGLIALTEGETLTAVANMVSSLQEYEKRKKSSSVHYLAFQPKNLEEINDNLQSGLSALNERNNDLAMKYFTSAVFNFDSFYGELGLAQ